MSTGIQVKYDPKWKVFVSCWSVARPKVEELPPQYLRSPCHITYTSEDHTYFGNYASTRADNG